MPGQTSPIRVETKLYALVRDRNGKPKIDGDPNDLPEPIKALLTDAERRELGVE